MVFKITFQLENNLFQFHRAIMSDFSNNFGHYFYLVFCNLTAVHKNNNKLFIFKPKINLVFWNKAIV